MGTKKQAQETVKEEAIRAGEYYVNERWLGGMLTNYQTIKKRIDRLFEIEKNGRRRNSIRFTQKRSHEADG